MRTLSSKKDLTQSNLALKKYLVVQHNSKFYKLQANSTLSRDPLSSNTLHLSSSSSKSSSRGLEDMSL